MNTLIEQGKVPIRIWTDDIDPGAMQQLRNTASLPFIHPHGIAAMPDVHWGLGATIGSVIPTVRAIVPAAVGVDIGCGMMAQHLGGAKASSLPDSLAGIRSEIEGVVPTGFDRNERREDQNTDGVRPLYDDFKWLEEKHPRVFERRKTSAASTIYSQFGSLGGGNHFIELCIDESDGLWVMLHSGSRGIGNAIGQYFISLAREEMTRMFITLPDRDLAYFSEGSEQFEDYTRAVSWAQHYAAMNRYEMMRRILTVLHRHLTFTEAETAINCHHNYVERENHFGQNVWLTRKGAIRARSGDLGIIPGSMGAKSYIVRGRGNADSYHSCSHGAGRRFGRKEARRQFTVEDLRQQTEGIECRKDSSVLDEIPSAYKDIDTVMANQTDLVEVVHTLKQVLCVKGA